MADWLLLRIPATDEEPVSWAVADAQGQLLSMPSQDTGGGLHTMATGRKVAFLVPAGEVSFFQAMLPSGNEARLLQLAPFALEDQLSQDIDSLHFAVGPREPGTGTVPVAVTERANMRQWLDRAARLQLIPQALFSESDLAPSLPGHVTMVVSTPINLLQGDYKPRGRSTADWKAWRWPAGLAAALLLMHVAGSLWQLHQLHKASAALDESTAQLYGSIFPGQRPGIDPRRTLERRLSALAGGGGARGELNSLLAAVAAAKQNVPVAKLESLNFKPGSMQLKLTAPDASTLEQFNQALRAGGYAAELSAGNARGGSYEGQVQLSGTGS